MKTTCKLVAIVITMGLFVSGALAQDRSTVAAARSETGKAGSMMSGGMLMGQNETGKMVEQLIRSFAAIEAEKDPAAVQPMLARHGALLKELQEKVQAQSRMMDVMQHMMTGSMMDGMIMDGKLLDVKLTDEKGMSGRAMSGTASGGQNKK